MSPSAKLHQSVMRWIFQQGWSSLRDIQENAIDPILANDTDELISASTASGKTEAYFLPAISALVEANDPGGIIIYVSPLKALINDQYRRLAGLSKATGIRVTPWHGDSPQTAKTRFIDSPGGILLITPESLEAMLMTKPDFVSKSFKSVHSIVIDEFHYFIGIERGMQLSSLLTRIEQITGRLIKNQIPRIGLSATLGNIESVPRLLRPNGRLPCHIIQGKSNSAIQLQIRGYRNPKLLTGDDERKLAEYRICEDLYKYCRGTSSLIFANSRGRTETVSAQLSDFCQQNSVPNEFFPHHGSLSKDARHYLESRLQKEKDPTTGVCTMTLELGIDIGNVDAVYQYTSPSSVHGLRQRVGRSGRRNGVSTLRLLIPEDNLDSKSSVIDRLRFDLVESLAITKLLVSTKWFEPADTSLPHYSTLLQQTLSVLCQSGSVNAANLYTLLCKEGPFNNVTKENYISLLRGMGAKNLIEQLGSGEIILGKDGEKLTSHYSFYAVFNVPEEYRIIYKGKIIGSIPLVYPLQPGQNFVFAGKRWLVNQIDSQQQAILVNRSKFGSAPKFGGDKSPVHQRIRQEMLAIYKSKSSLIDIGGVSANVLNGEAKELFEEGMASFADMGLDDSPFRSNGNVVEIFTWSCDKIANTLTAMLTSAGIDSGAYSSVITVTQASQEEIVNCLLRSKEPGGFDLEAYVSALEVKESEKYDQFLPNDLLSQSFKAKHFDFIGAVDWINSNCKTS